MLVGVRVGASVRVVVADGLGVKVGVGGGVIVAGADVGVFVAGGVTSSRSLLPG